MNAMEDMYLNLLKNTISMRGRINEQDNGDIKEKIKDFFKANPYPEDSKVHSFAQSLGMEPDDLETHIYAVLCDYLKIGKHQDVPDDKFDSKELAMGIEVEKEHTNFPEIAKIIAKDHLSEPGLEDYYTRLKKMEEEAKKEKGIKEND